MALDGSKTIIAATGHYYVPADATAGTLTGPVVAKPASLPEDGSAWTPTTGWLEVGHTSADSPLTIGRDGGDVTTNGTWQAPSLDVSVAPITYSLQFTLLQLDWLGNMLYYGGGEPDADGYWLTPLVPAAQNTSLLARVMHSSGTRSKWFYFAKVGILGSDSSEAATDGYMGMPVTATILDSTGETNALGGLFAISGSGQTSA